jgi:hypothetical protein
MYIQFCANLGKIVAEILAMIRQALEKESMSRTRVYEWKIPFSPKRKKTRRVNSRVKSMLIIFFGIKVIVFKKFVPAAQTGNSAYYSDV